MCAVCRRKKVSQEHHIIYEPFEIKIGVCAACHREIHGRSTGAPRMPDSTKRNIRAVRGIPDELWKIVKIRSALEERTIGDFISSALAHYLERVEVSQIG